MEQQMPQSVVSNQPQQQQQHQDAINDNNNELSNNGNPDYNTKSNTVDYNDNNNNNNNNNNKQQQHHHHQQQQARQQRSSTSPCMEQQTTTSAAAATTTTTPKHYALHTFVPQPPRNAAIYQNGTVFINSLHGWQPAPHYVHGGEMAAEQPGAISYAVHKGISNNMGGGNRTQRRSRGGRGGNSHHMGGGRNSGGRNDYHNHQSINLSHQHHTQRHGAALLETPVNLQPQPLMALTAAGTPTPNAALLHYTHAHQSHEQQQQQQHNTQQQQQQQQHSTPHQQHQQQQSPRETPTYTHNAYAAATPIGYANYHTYPAFYATTHGGHILHTASAQGATTGPVLMTPIYNPQVFNYMSGYMFPQMYNTAEYQYVTAAGPADVGVPGVEAQVLDVNAQVQDNVGVGGAGAAAIPTAGSMLQQQIWPGPQIYAAPAHHAPHPGTEYDTSIINTNYAIYEAPPMMHDLPDQMSTLQIYDDGQQGMLIAPEEVPQEPNDLMENDTQMIDNSNTATVMPQLMPGDVEQPAEVIPHEMIMNDAENTANFYAATANTSEPVATEPAMLQSPSFVPTANATETLNATPTATATATATEIDNDDDKNNNNNNNNNNTAQNDTNKEIEPQQQQQQPEAEEKSVVVDKETVEKVEKPEEQQQQQQQQKQPLKPQAEIQPKSQNQKSQKQQQQQHVEQQTQKSTQKPQLQREQSTSSTANKSNHKTQKQKQQHEAQQQQNNSKLSSSQKQNQSNEFITAKKQQQQQQQSTTTTVGVQATATTTTTVGVQATITTTTTVGVQATTTTTTAATNTHDEVPNSSKQQQQQQQKQLKDDHKTQRQTQTTPQVQQQQQQQRKPLSYAGVCNNRVQNDLEQQQQQQQQVRRQKNAATTSTTTTNANTGDIATGEHDNHNNNNNAKKLNNNKKQTTTVSVTAVPNNNHNNNNNHNHNNNNSNKKVDAKNTFNGDIKIAKSTTPTTTVGTANASTTTTTTTTTTVNMRNENKVVTNNVDKLNELKQQQKQLITTTTPATTTTTMSTSSASITAVPGEIAAATAANQQQQQQQNTKTASRHVVANKNSVMTSTTTSTNTTSTTLEQLATITPKTVAANESNAFITTSTATPTTPPRTPTPATPTTTPTTILTATTSTSTHNMRTTTTTASTANLNANSGNVPPKEYSLAPPVSNASQPTTPSWASLFASNANKNNNTKIVYSETSTKMVNSVASTITTPTTQFNGSIYNNNNNNHKNNNNKNHNNKKRTNSTTTTTSTATTTPPQIKTTKTAATTTTTNVQPTRLSGGCDVTPKPETTDGESLKKKRTSEIDEHTLRYADFLLKYKTDLQDNPLVPCGLTNRSNYCYINAILQALISCPPFVNLFKSMPPPMQMEGSINTPTVNAMTKFVSNFDKLPQNVRMTKRKEGRSGKNNSSADFLIKPPFEPSEIYKLWNEGRPDEGRQEDAEEFLGYMLNKLHDEMLEVIKLIHPVAQKRQQSTDDNDDWQTIRNTRNRSSITRQSDEGRTPLSDIFRGDQRSRLSREGDQSTDDIQPFYTLPLNISKANSVREALEMMVNKNQIDGLLGIKSKQAVNAWQQIMLEKLPTVLILHLKCFDFRSDGCTKLLKRVEFPAELKIFTKILSCKDYTQKQRKYRLFAVVYHEGTEIHKGHYITDVYHCGYKNWLRYDDSYITSIEEEQVLHPPSPRVPYLLFYRRCDTLPSYSNENHKN